MRPPKVPRFTRSAIPRHAGAVSSTSHISGMNPRKSKLTELTGTNPKLYGGTSISKKSSSSTKPGRQDVGFFNIGFGGPGSTEPV